MSALKTEALIFRSFDWKDSSKIVTLYTREAGKLKVMARGAKRRNSRYQGLLETISLVEAVVYISEKRQIQTLGEVSLENSFAAVKKDYQKTGYSFAVLELCDRFLQPGESDPVFFDFLITLLGEMAQAGAAPVVFWYFLLKLCSYLGFRLNLEHCLACGEPARGRPGIFSMSEGGFVCSNCQTGEHSGWPLPGPVIDFLVRLQGISHKKVGREAPAVPPDNFGYSDFLIAYLRHHSDEKLELHALKIFK
jgi:DNA repair protein RecO (recombination protein O)